MINSNIFKSLLSTIVIASIFTAAPVFADKLELTNGKIFEGKVISVGSKQVILKGQKGKMIFSKKQVRKIVFEDEEERITSQKVKTTEKQEVKKETTKKEKEKKVVKKESPKKKTTKTQKVKKEEPKKTVKKEEPKNKTAKTQKAKKEEPKKVVKKETNKAEKTKVAKATPKTESPELKPRKVISTKQTNQPEPKKVETVKPVAKQPFKAVPAKKVVQAQPPKSNIVINIPKVRPIIDFVTFIKGSQSNNLYFGIYSNDLSTENLTVFFPDQTPQSLTFKVHAQQNGPIPPLYTAASVMYVLKDGRITNPTQAIEVEKTNYHEWFSNLENIAGISGEKAVSLAVPKDAIGAIILGNRPGSKNNLVGYISNIKIDGRPIDRIISN